MTMIYLMIYLLQIDPTVAVDNVSSNYGLLGSMFIIVLSLLVGALILIWKSTKKQIDVLNKRIDESEEENKECRKEFFEYIKQKNDIFVEVIKNYSDSRNDSRLVMEKLLMKS